MVIRLTTKFHCEIYLTPSIDCVLQALINVRFMVMSPSTMKCFPDRICSCSCLSNDTSINTYDQHCLHKATQLSRSESWPGRYDHMVPFTLMTVPKLAVNPPLVALGFRTTDPTLKWVWNSGALVPPGMDVDAGTPFSMSEDHGWAISAGQGSRADTLGPPIGSQFGLST